MEGLKLPHSLEAEQSVLGGLMIDNERWDNVSERVTADDFYSRPHRTILRKCSVYLSWVNLLISITLSEALEQNAELESVGGFAYLAELSKNTPSAANINAYADIVRERAVVRDMIKVANEIADAGFDPQGDAPAKIRSILLNLASFKLPKPAPIKMKGQKQLMPF